MYVLEVMVPETIYGYKETQDQNIPHSRTRYRLDNAPYVNLARIASFPCLFRKEVEMEVVQTTANTTALSFYMSVSHIFR